MRPIYLLISLAVFVFISCTKNKNHTSIEGKVINAITKQAVDSVEIFICDGLRVVGGDNENKNCISTYTDLNGEFKIEIESDNANLYFSKLGYEFNHYTEGAVEGVILLPKGENLNQTYEIEPKCMFAPYFENINAQLNDTLIANIGQNYRCKYTFHSSNNRYFYGIGPFKINYSGFMPYVGNMHVIYKLNYTKNGIWNEYIDSVYIPQGVVYEDTIRY